MQLNKSFYKYLCSIYNKYNIFNCHMKVNMQLIKITFNYNVFFQLKLKNY